jgi:ribose transport system substrate-binding protein
MGGATRRWVVTVAAGACVVLAGCGEGTSSSAPASSGATTDAATKATGAVPTDAGAARFEGAKSGSGKGVRIGYISNGEKISFVKIVSDGIREQARKAGAKLLFCDSQVDAAKALECARNLRTQQVDVLIEYQNDAKAAPEICTAGPQVPVIAVSIKQEPCQAAFMGADNARAGEIAGKGLGAYAKREWDCDYDAVVLLEAQKTGEINELRVRGALRAFEAVCGKAKNLKVVDGDGTIDQYQTRFADTLTALPGQHRILLLTINDDAGLGALAAAGSQGRKKDIFVVAQGADPTSHCQIATNPQWIGDSAYFPERFGEIIIPNAIRAAKGAKIPESLLVPHVFVTKDTVAKYYDVSGC